MTRYIDADKIISHLNNEIEAYGDADINCRPIDYGTYLGLKYAKSLVETAETADIAMKIFDEIEHPARAAIILLKFEKDEKIRNAKIKCYKDLIGYIAELKKKYIEQK